MNVLCHSIIKRQYVNINPTKKKGTLQSIDNLTIVFGYSMIDKSNNLKFVFILWKRFVNKYHSYITIMMNTWQLSKYQKNVLPTLWTILLSMTVHCWAISRKFDCSLIWKMCNGLILDYCAVASN